ncbi:MAG: tetratricopeptide repeat protein [Gemmataceae bacterium]
MVDSLGTLHTWQLTRLRAELAKIGLDWPTEPLAPAPNLPPITQVLFENPERLGDAAYFQRLKTEKRILRLWSNPLDLKAIDELSREEFNNRRYASGLKLSDFFLKLDPKNLEMRSARQRMAIILGHHPEAILHANMILERKPGDHATRYDRADALAALGRHAEALADYRLLLRDAYPNDPFLQIDIGEQLQMVGDPAGALAEFRAAAKTVINNDSYSETTINNLAWYLVVGPPASRDPALALTLIDTAIRKKPDQSPFLNTHALVLVRNGRGADAIAAIQKSFQNKNNDPEFDYLVLGLAFAVEKDRGKVLAALNAAWSVAGKSRPRRTIEKWELKLLYAELMASLLPPRAP